MGDGEVAQERREGHTQIAKGLWCAHNAINCSDCSQVGTSSSCWSAPNATAVRAGCQPSQLPPEAGEIIRECACLPLAVAMVGAQLRGKPDRWRKVLQKLQNADLDRIRQIFPEYSHPDLLRAIDVSMEALDDDLRGLYLDFALFPEDCPIPEPQFS